MKRVRSSLPQRYLSLGDASQAARATRLPLKISFEDLLAELHAAVFRYAAAVALNRSTVSQDEERQRQRLIEALARAESVLNEPASKPILDIVIGLGSFQPIAYLPDDRFDDSRFRAEEVELRRALGVMLQALRNDVIMEWRAEMRHAISPPLLRGSAFDLLVRELAKAFRNAFDREAGVTKDGPFVRFAISILDASEIRQISGAQYKGSSIVDALRRSANVFQLSDGED